MTEYLLHVDCDCFFASVEMREHPEYFDVPLAVGGALERRGVIATCNYPARQFGVRSAMPSWKALQLCPDLLLVTGNMSLYQEVSSEVMSVLSSYTRMMEKVSIDEAYLIPLEAPELVANALRQQIQDSIGITVSVGVAPNRFLSKIASGWNKPDGLTVISASDVDGFVSELPLSAIPGVGPKLTEKLAEDGFHTCGQLRTLSLPKLIHRYGKMGAVLFQRCRGLDDRPLKQGRERKSISIERTFAADLKSTHSCLQQLPDLWERWQQRVHRFGCAERLMSPYVTVRYADFSRVSHSEAGVVADYRGFERLLSELLATRQEDVRLIGIGARLQSMHPGQGDLFI